MFADAARRPWAPSPPPRCRPAGQPPRPTLGNGSRRGPARAAPPLLPRPDGPASCSATNSAQATCIMIFGPHGLVPQDGAVAFFEVSETTLLLSREHAPPPAAPARQGRARSEQSPLARSDSNTRVAVSRSSIPRMDPDHEPKPLVRASSMGFLPRVGAGVLILPSVGRASKTRKRNSKTAQRVICWFPISNPIIYFGASGRYRHLSDNNAESPTTQSLSEPFTQLRPLNLCNPKVRSGGPPGCPHSRLPPEWPARQPVSPHSPSVFR